MTETAINQHIIAHLNSLFSSTYESLEDILDGTDLMIIERLNDILSGIKILDGSAGDGEFLIAAYNIINSIKEKINQKLSCKQVSNETTLDIQSFTPYGMEINPEAIVCCHKNMLKNFSESLIPSAKKLFESNIIRGDFLDSSLATWKNLPPTTEGFDIILGNPPWGGKLTKKQKDKYYEQFAIRSPKRNLNTFSLFIYKATELLAPDRGILAYLLPKNVTRSNQYIYLREFLLTNFQIIKINFHGLFKDVTQEFISLTGLRRNEIPPKHTIVVDHKTIIPQSAYLANIDYIFTKEFNSRSQQLIQLIKSGSNPLGHFLTITRGEELSKRGGVMFCPTCSWVPLSSRKRKIICPQCHQSLNEKDLHIKYLIQRKEKPPYIQSILTGDDFEAYMILSTHFIDPSINYRSKKSSLNYLSPKLVVQKIKRFPCAAYDSANHWTTQNVYNLILKPEYTERTELLYYILALLNSSLYRWFYESQFNLGSKYTNAISIRNLRRLPLKTPDFNNPLFYQIFQLAKIASEEKNLENRSKFIEEVDRLVLQYYQCENIALPTIEVNSLF